jgi:hypothetical protein
MRAAAAAGDLESFKQGVPNQEVADEMFAAVRQGMGIKNKEAAPAESLEEQTYDRNKLIAVVNLNGEAKEFDLTGRFQGDTRTQIKQAETFLNDFLKKKSIPSWSMEIHYQGAVSKTNATGQDIPDTPELDDIANQARQRLQQQPRGQ